MSERNKDVKKKIMEKRDLIKGENPNPSIKGANPNPDGSFNLGNLPITPHPETKKKEKK